MDAASPRRRRREAVTLGLQVMSRTDERWWEAELHRLHGETLDEAGTARSGAHRVAEEALRTAIATARGQHAQVLELRATASLARRLRRRGRTAEARGMLASCCEQFSGGPETPDLSEARALLRELA